MEPKEMTNDELLNDFCNTLGNQRRADLRKEIESRLSAPPIASDEAMNLALDFHHYHQTKHYHNLGKSEEEIYNLYVEYVNKKQMTKEPKQMTNRELTSKEKNEAIAKILGFEQYGITVNGEENAIIAWSYPEEYGYLVSGTPMHNCPDFIGMVEQCRQIKKITQGWE
jgi:hypothetical protein